MLKVEDALSFVREKGLLNQWTDLQVLNALRKAIQDCALAFDANEGKLTGLVFGRWEDEGKTFHATCFAGELKPFVNYLKTLHPQVTEITGHRGDKFICYKVGKDL